jgi:hypothetical protein
MMRGGNLGREAHQRARPLTVVLRPVCSLSSDAISLQLAKVRMTRTTLSFAGKPRACFMNGEHKMNPHHESDTAKPSRLADDSFGKSRRSLRK